MAKLVLVGIIVIAVLLVIWVIWGGMIAARIRRQRRPDDEGNRWR
jgi:hypothetical protein